MILQRTRKDLLLGRAEIFSSTRDQRPSLFLGKKDQVSVEEKPLYWTGGKNSHEPDILWGHKNEKAEAGTILEGENQGREGTLHMEASRTFEPAKSMEPHPALTRTKLQSI